MGIRQNIEEMLAELPEGVLLVAAAKARQPWEMAAAIEAGIKVIGHNYVQEAEGAREAIGDKAQWHLIGHLQKNKVKKAVSLFDMIETVDSVEIAREIDKRCAQTGKIMPVLIEINSGREGQKAGVFPEHAEQLARDISSLPNVRLMGFMTVGPYAGDPEDSRPYFMETRKVFDRIKRLSLPDTEMKYLSMGMSNSYKVALEEGANIIRLGTRIFGPRPDKPC
ncbi:MAG: YggS family pyridoxal phosphate-dependent enzyme [Chloroflexota bacterium]